MRLHLAQQLVVGRRGQRLAADVALDHSLGHDPLTSSGSHRLRAAGRRPRRRPRPRARALRAVPRPSTPARTPWRRRAGSSSRLPEPGTTYPSATRLRGLEQQLAGPGRATADHDLVRVERVDRVRNRRSRRARAQSSTIRRRRLVAVLGGLNGFGARARACPRARSRPSAESGCASAASATSRSSAWPAATDSSDPGCGKPRRRRHRSARQVETDERVSELAGAAGRAAVDPAAEHDPAADAGPDRDHHEVVRDQPQLLVVCLGERGHGRVVVDEHRHPEPLAQHLRGAAHLQAGC